MNTSKKTSLTRLYEQRKQRHPLPEQLKKQWLAKSVPAKAKPQWQFVLPTLAASMMVVIIFWPQRQPYTQIEFEPQVEWLELPAPAQLTETETETETELVPQTMLSDQTSQRLAMPSPAKEQLSQLPRSNSDVAPLEETTVVSKAMPRLMPSFAPTEDATPEETNAESTSADLSLSASRIEINPSLPQPAKDVQFVKVIDAQTGHYENCAGERVELNIELTADEEIANGQWAQVLVNQNMAVQLTATSHAVACLNERELNSPPTVNEELPAQ